MAGVFGNDKITRDVISCSENPAYNTVNSATNFNVLET